MAKTANLGSSPTSFVDRLGTEFVSEPELAKRAGVSEGAIAKARRAGWIEPEEKMGTKMYRMPAALNIYLAHAGPQAGITLGSRTASEDDAPPGGERRGALAVKADFTTALLQIEYERKLGSHVPMEEVDKLWRGAGESLKKSLMAIPDRIAPEFGGENQHKLYRALVTELTHALAALDIDYETMIEESKQAKK